MGSRMAQRLLAAGHSVTGYNRTKSKAQRLLDAGMQWGESPRSVAMAAEIIFSMVTNTEALQAITSGANGILAGLAPGKIYIDMSTVSPAASREIAQQVEAKGAQMLDAPVSGSVDYSRRRQALHHGRRQTVRRSKARCRSCKRSVQRRLMSAAMA